jgi:DNA-binding response OmpR family regulator
VSEARLILCADDDEDILDLVALRLERAGYQVLKATDGEAALALVRERRPALVVLDVMMPRRSGFDVLATLRADPELRDTKVIMLSARVQDVDVERGLEAGADAYLIKPFKFSDLVECVGELLLDQPTT